MRYHVSFILVIVFSMLSIISAAQETDIKDIVLLNSYHPTFKWTYDVTFGVMNQLQTKDGYRVSIEFMDSKRFQTEEHFAALNKYWATKYKAVKVDGVICSDNHAFEFFLKYGNKIWGDVPMTFCGVNNIEDFNIETTGYKGVAETINMEGTLELIHTLQPDLDTLIVISDKSLSGTIFTNQFQSIAASRFPNLKYRIINAVTAEQLGKELQNIYAVNKAVYLLSMYIPRAGISRDMIDEAGFLLSKLDVPVYGNWDFLFGDFIVGGVIMGGYQQGILAAYRLKEILNGKGENLSYLATTPEKIIFDYKMLTRYSLNPDLLPQQTEFINKPISFWEKYKKQMTYGLVVLGVLISIIVGLLRIIALKNSAEKKLLKSESRLGLALEGANLGLWDVDFINENIFFSNQVPHLLDYKSPDDFSLRFDNWPSVFHPQDIDQLKEAFQMHAQDVIPSFRSEIRLKTFEGKYKWYSLNGRIIEKEEGKPVRMIGILMNINFQKEFEEQLKIAKEKAEESDRLKSSFLANMSHEIRTPMNAILGFTDLIISENLKKEESERYLKLIRNSGESLLGLINDIIDFSKIQSGQLTLRNVAFDLNQLIDDMTMVAKTLIERQQKKITFITEKGSPQENFFIVADPLRLEQILYNLVSNAIKFTNSGKILLNYQIIDPDTLQFSVKDTGKGVAPEHHDMIFERFRQVETSFAENTGGTGLGLAITKSLLNLMGGRISVESQLNEGATFTFSITYKPAAISPELSPENI